MIFNNTETILNWALSYWHRKSIINGSLCWSMLEHVLCWSIVSHTHIMKTYIKQYYVLRVYFSTLTFLFFITFILNYAIFNLQDGPFRGCSRMRGAKKAPLTKMSHTYLAMMKLGTVKSYLKKIQKIYKSRETVLEFCWHQHFFTGNWQILLYQEVQIQIAFLFIISNSFNSFLVFKDVLQFLQ